MFNFLESQPVGYAERAIAQNAARMNRELTDLERRHLQEARDIATREQELRRQETVATLKRRGKEKKEREAMEMEDFPTLRAREQRESGLMGMEDYLYR